MFRGPRLIASGIGCGVLGGLLYMVPDMPWYKPLPAFLVAPFLVWLGVVFSRGQSNHKG